jgi:ketosteroid isomerase-like protein
MKNTIVILLTLSGLTLISCDKKINYDTESEKEKIKILFQTWVKDVSEKGDAETYFKYVTSDFMVSEPNSPVQADRNSIEIEVKGMLANNSIRLEDWNSEEIIISKDVAIHRHSGVFVLMPKNDTITIRLHLKYLDILKQDDKGEWKTYLHSYMPDRQSE